MKTKDLRQFRGQLYHELGARRDAAMDLLDAMCSARAVRSAVELSLEPAFRRGHASIHDTVDAFWSLTSARGGINQREKKERPLRQVVAGSLEAPQGRKYWLFALDALPVPRPHAKCLTDRGFVYQPGGVTKQVPVVIGHRYSQLMALPERGVGDGPWVLPLSIGRVASDTSASSVGIEQVAAILEDPKLAWHDQLCALVIDSGYSNAPSLAPLAKHKNLVAITRLRGDRVLYRQPPPRRPGQRGRPCWYGPRFALRDESTWDVPEETISYCDRLHPRQTIELSVWSNLLLHGTFRHELHRNPLTLIRVRRLDQDGQPVDRKPMWLGVVGERRAEIQPAAAQMAYQQRFDQEHAHRFQKQHLLLGHYQTPQTEHEENWLSMAILAYAMLFAARKVAGHLPRPWEPQTLSSPAAVATPSMVQRDFARILAQVGTPARPPKPRGKSPGRSPGHSPGRKPRQPVVKKLPYRTNKVRGPTKNAA